ncbi:MAG: MBL fold metallo-hydrolase [Gemmatimonadaceae bacterium]|nr:MBL fold metallo-hydrolase [Gemmatimonadaceae bacterium]
MNVKGFAVGPLQENSWLITEPSANAAVLVDPGDEAPRLLAAVADSGCTLQALWLTHAHFDHLGAVAAILRHVPVPVFLHPLDRPLYDLAAASAQRFGLSIEQPTADTVSLGEGDVLSIGETEFRVWHLPGHAPGHVAFIGAGLCVSGDVLFEGSIGRTDLPGCDPRAMHQSLQRLATLPPDTRVLTGHGEPTTIARECETNPFLRGVARPVGA